MSCQEFSVSTAINYLVDICPNLWCNNYKLTFFLGDIFFYLYISFVSPKNTCFLCALCGGVTEFFFPLSKYTAQNHLLNKEVYPKLINVIIEKPIAYIWSLKYVVICSDKGISNITADFYLNFSFLLCRGVISVHKCNIFIRIL